MGLDVFQKRKKRFPKIRFVKECDAGIKYPIDWIHFKGQMLPISPLIPFKLLTEQNKMLQTSEHLNSVQFVNVCANNLSSQQWRYLVNTPKIGSTIKQMGFIYWWNHFIFTVYLTNKMPKRLTFFCYFDWSVHTNQPFLQIHLTRSSIDKLRYSIQKCHLFRGHTQFKSVTHQFYQWKDF